MLSLKENEVSEADQIRDLIIPSAFPPLPHRVNQKSEENKDMRHLQTASVALPCRTAES